VNAINAITVAEVKTSSRGTPRFFSIRKGRGEALDKRLIGDTKFAGAPPPEPAFIIA
jgi:hypothetical protein